jgi:hypothetical protein
MISKSSLQYFSLINRLKYKFSSIFINEKRYFNLILKGILPRPQYALGLFLCAAIAKQQGIKKFSAIEFGCWEGEGLLDLEHYSEEIEKIFDIKIEIYGFEGGTGMPKPTDFKDRLYQFSEGEMKFSTDENKNRLKKSQFIIGKFKETVPNFLNGKFAPIGCVFNDADYFSSTNDSFGIFKNSENLLPKVFLYFDDLNFSSKLTGELGAINHFNKNNNLQIESIPEMAETMSIYWKKWIFLGKRFFLIHNFNHNLYNKRYINPFYKNLP